MKTRRTLRVLALALALLTLPAFIGSLFDFARGKPFGLAQGKLAAQGAGPLVVVGGGSTGEDIIARALQISGGPAAVVAVLPQSSAVADAGDGSVQMWLKAGARESYKLGFDDRAAARRGLERATLIWMPGGSQSRFMDAITGTGLDDVIRSRHQAGTTVGGTSAGAAVLSRIMITGDSDLQSITAGKTVTREGLGLWPDAIVDQHFLRRQRVNRLIGAVLDHPSLVGIGVDESTAVIVRGSAFEVIGKSAVVVVDGRRGAISPTPPGGVHAGTGLMLHVLRAGMSWDLK
jgi:cyanophycinase